MDRKEEEVTETYPTIFFAVNDFQDVLQDLTISEEGELVRYSSHGCEGRFHVC